MKKVVLVLLLVMPFLVSAETDSKAGYVSKIDYTLEQPFGGFASVYSLAHYFTIVYQFALGIVGIIAVVLIMFGGLRWVAAAGNESIIGEAKEIITSAVVGLAIALLSYIILAFINPQFTTATLSVPQIVITGEDSIVDLPTCDTADFKGKTCINTDTNASSNCEEVTCGDKALVDGAYCRGMTCGYGEGKCYRGPVDPMTYACQNTYCGEWAQNCANSGYKEMPSAKVNFTSAFNECTCPYYEKVTAKDLNITDLRTSVLTDQQEQIFYALCGETILQESWENGIVDDPAGYGYTLAASSAALKGWNCGFSCYNDEQKFDYISGEIYVNCPVAKK